MGVGISFFGVLRGGEVSFFTLVDPVFVMTAVGLVGALRVMTDFLRGLGVTKSLIA